MLERSKGSVIGEPVIPTYLPGQQDEDPARDKDRCATRSHLSEARVRATDRTEIQRVTQYKQKHCRDQQRATAAKGRRKQREVQRLSGKAVRSPSHDTSGCSFTKHEYVKHKIPRGFSFSTADAGCGELSGAGLHDLMQQAIPVALNLQPPRRLSPFTASLTCGPLLVARSSAAFIPVLILEQMYVRQTVLDSGYTFSMLALRIDIHQCST